MNGLYCCYWVFCISGSFSSFLNNIKKNITNCIPTDPPQILLNFFLHFSTDRKLCVISVSGTYRGQLLSSVNLSVSVTDDQKLVGNAIDVYYRRDAFVFNKINNGNKKVIGKSVGNCATDNKQSVAVVTDENHPTIPFSSVRHQ